MSNRIVTFIAFISLVISLTALWKTTSLASHSTLRDKVVEAFSEDPIPFFETAMKGGEAHRKRSEENAQKEQQEKVTKIWNNLTATHSPFAGNVNGDTTIVSFFDYNCGYCRKAHEVIEKLIQDDPTLKVIYRPVSLFTDPLVIRATLAAQKQGKYQEIHRALMGQNIEPTKDAVKDLAKKLGLDVPKFLQDLDSDEVKAQAAENGSLYKQLNLAGTPTYIVEKTSVIPGHIELDEFKSLLKSLKAEKAKAEVKTAA